MNFFNYVMDNTQQIYKLFIEHIELTVISVVLAIFIGVPLGILISHFSKINKPVLAFANIVQAVPSMALLGFLIPFLGIGVLPSIFMVVIYSLLPIIKNTFTSISGINHQVIEAAEGIGMTKLQVLFKIKIPMALPVIMAGIRISAVTAVGLMTMAAFIGAGGLGYLVFSGIRTANNYQILAGAIPACFLALFIDFITAIIEKAVVPYGLNIKKKKISKREKTFHKIVIITSVIAILFTFFNASRKRFIPTKKTIVVASKDFSEQEILGNMLAELIEDRTDLNVKKQLSLGGSQIVFGAIDAGEVDMYIDYTGTLYSDVLKHNPIAEKVNTRDVYDIAKKEIYDKYNLIVGNEFKFNNTFAVGVRKDVAEKYNLKTISDLENVSHELIISPTLEFMNREDGLPGLKKEYKDLNFKKIIPIDGSPRYTALTIKESDVVDAYATDGLIKTYDVKLLKDDKEFFLPYHAVLITREKILKKYPELEGITKELEEILTDEVMQGLNYEVDDLKKNPEDVAHEFLIKNNLINR